MIRQQWEEERQRQAEEERQRQAEEATKVAADKKQRARDNFKRIGNKVIAENEVARNFRSAVDGMANPTSFQRDMNTLRTFLTNNNAQDFIVRAKSGANKKETEKNEQVAKQQMIENIVHMKLTKSVKDTTAVDSLIKPTWDQIQDLKKSVTGFNAIQKTLNKPEIPFVFDALKPLGAQMEGMWATLGTHAKDSTAAFEGKGDRLTSKEALAKLHLEKLGRESFFQKAWTVIKNKVDNWKMNRIDKKIEKTDAEHMKLLQQLHGEELPEPFTPTKSSNSLKTLKEIRAEQKLKFLATKSDVKDLQKQRQEQIDSMKISRAQAMKNAWEARKAANAKAEALRNEPLAKKGEAPHPADAPLVV